MADTTPQSYQNHRRFVPLFHVGVFGVLVINLASVLWTLYRSPGPGNGVSVLLALALLGLFFFSRLFALAAQDRVIRLEERMRLGELLPADLKPRIGELTAGQLIALRFASDGELAELTRKVLDEKIADREQIKRLIKTWRADHLRV